MNREVTADDGCRLWTAQTGTGAPMVLCHGGPGLWDYLEPVAELLGDLAHTVRWDQRGCGRSERRGPDTVARSVADLDAIRQHLGVPHIDVLGHSWGATLALRYALAHPERVNRLIYVAGTGIDPDHTWKPAFRRSMIRRIRGADAERWRELDCRERTPAEDREYAILQWSADFVDLATARQHAERMATPWLGINWEHSRSINTEIRQYLNEHNVAALCRALAVATLIIDGDQDPRPRWAVDSLHQALPNAQRVIIAGAGHLPWVEDPDGFRQAVARFVRQDDTVAAQNLSPSPSATDATVDKDQQVNGFRQIWTDEPAETRTSPPWLDDVTDQDFPDSNTAHSPRTPDPQ
jgi:proline iminopeptidase